MAARLEEQSAAQMDALTVVEWAAPRVAKTAVTTVEHLGSPRVACSVLRKVGLTASKKAESMAVPMAASKVAWTAPSTAKLSAVMSAAYWAAPTEKL